MSPEEEAIVVNAAFMGIQSGGLSTHSNGSMHLCVRPSAENVKIWMTCPLSEGLRCRNN